MGKNPTYINGATEKEVCLSLFLDYGLFPPYEKCMICGKVAEFQQKHALCSKCY